MNFAGKTALVTGGSRGIGRAVCLELAGGGANVALCYAGNEAAARETVRAVEALGVKALAVRCDVSDGGQVSGLMDAVVHGFQRIDILVNNAGITRDNLLMRMSEEDFDAVIAANLKGAFLCMKAASRLMLKHFRGEYQDILDDMDAVAPGFIDTDMTAAMQDSARAAVLASVPMARLGQAEEVARAVAFLAGDDAAYITGQVLAVDGGMAM